MNTHRIDTTTVALGAITALGALLRVATLDAKSFWADEGATIQVLDDDFGGMLARIVESEAIPPLYYVLAWAWSRPFGLGEIGMRSLSAIFGIALIIVAYVAAREVFSRRAGLVAAALVAVNPFLIWYSQEARAYALLALVGGLSVLWFLRARAGKRHALAWWSVFAALVLVTHYYGVFLVATEAVWLVFAVRRWRSLVPAGIVLAIVGAALIPLVVAQEGGSRAGWIEDQPFLRRVSDLPPDYMVGFDLVPPRIAAVPVAIACLVALWLLMRRATASYRRSALVLAGVAVIAAGSAIGLAVAGIDYVVARALIWVIFPAALVVAAGLGLPQARRLGPVSAMAACVVSVGVVASVADVPKYGEDWRSAAEAMGPAPGGRAIVLTRDHGVRALGVYLGARPMPPSGAAVREIVLLGSSGSEFAAGQSQPPPVQGFGRVETLEIPFFTLARFRAARSVVVDPEELEGDLAQPADAVLVHR